MNAFFQSWQRKCGVLTLALALVFAGGWVRSFVVDDFVEFPIDDDSLTALETSEQALLVYWFSKVEETDVEPPVTPPQLAASSLESPDRDAEPAKVEPANSVDANFTEEESEDDWIIVGESASVRTHEVVFSCLFASPKPRCKIPFSYIVIPLTLLSAGLLLCRPRRVERPV